MDALLSANLDLAVALSNLAKAKIAEYLSEKRRRQEALEAYWQTEEGKRAGALIDQVGKDPDAGIRETLKRIEEAMNQAQDHKKKARN